MKFGLDRIYRLFANNWYYVLVNGRAAGYFSSNRGLKQGDPLSPYLFILASEAISRNLAHIQNSYPHLAYFSRRGLLIISHLGYVDDKIVFCNSIVNAQNAHENIQEVSVFDWAGC